MSCIGASVPLLIHCVAFCVSLSGLLKSILAKMVAFIHQHMSLAIVCSKTLLLCDESEKGYTWHRRDAEDWVATVGTVGTVYLEEVPSPAE